MAVLVTGLRCLFRGTRGCGRILMLVLLAGTAVAQVPASREKQVQAVFLFNFAQFVEWPATAFSAADSPLIIGILGEDPYGLLLDEVVKGERINDRPLEVRRYRRPEEVGECHILFVSRSEQGRLERLVSDLKGRSILTVSDSEGSAQRGVMIRYVTERGRIRLRINLDAARDAGLILSSKLLRAAEIVGTRKE